LLSAWGAASAAVQRDYVRTVLLTNPSTSRLRTLFVRLEQAARAELRAEGLPPSRCVIARTVDVRYRGQSYEIALPFSARLSATFHAAHRELYGYADPARPIEVVNLRVRASGRHAPVRAQVSPPLPRQPPERHRVRWSGRWMQAAAYLRAHLPIATVIRGPAVITEFSATTFIPPGWRGSVHRTGHLVLSHAR
jgi:N-methylhydantoinase A